MNEPIGLYIHVPWCVRKCPYCDFNSHALPDPSADLPTGEYLQRLLEDLDQEPEWVRQRSVSSIFFGGGTPSLLPAEAIATILDGVRARLSLAEDAEITLEANPGTAEATRFAAYRQAGVNRLSIGVQSFSDRALAALGRIHGAAEARAAIEFAQEGGFERINIDLMHGLPGQTRQEGLDDLHEALATGVTHLSWYQLTIERNTRFHSEPPILPVEEVLESIEDEGTALLESAGFTRYEVSAWARGDARCRHNLNYWRFGDYIGIGPGAHGKLTSRTPDGAVKISRTHRTRAPADWLAGMGAPRRIEREVPAAEHIEEFMLNALRLIDGCEISRLTEATDIAPQAVAPVLEALRAEGLLRADRLATTATGLRFLDHVVSRFLAAGR